MKVLLINPPTKEKPVVRDMAGGLGFDGGGRVVLPPLDLTYIAATLLDKGHTVKIIDADIEKFTNQKVCVYVQAYMPEVVIATVSLPSLYQDCEFLKELHGCFSGRVIAKTNITYAIILKEILERSLVDFSIYGECDLSINDIIVGKTKKGTAYFNQGEFIVEENNIIENLDTLPLPARKLLTNEKYSYTLLGDKVTTMQTSRGCPFPCADYCAYPLVQGRNWRARSPEHVLKETEDIVQVYDIRKILFRDATFTLDKERAYRICELIIKKKIHIQWWCETRVDRLDKNLMEKMKQAGCRGMNIGVETGDEKVLETQAKIGMTLNKLITIRNIAKELGLRLHFLLMIGLPEETKQSLYKTYKLLQKLKPESIGVCIITPYPGTPLYRKAKEKGWIETDDWSKFGGHFPIMHTDNLATSDLLVGKHLIEQGFAILKAMPWKRWMQKSRIEMEFRQWLSV